MLARGLIIRHSIVSLSFILLYLVLNQPEVLSFTRIGVVAWYPAIGLVMALLLGISPWYALLACLSDALASRIIYAQPIHSFSYIVGSIGISSCYGIAAYVLRGPMQLDLGLRCRRDVVRYVFVSATAAAGATIVGVGCLLADHNIKWSEYRPSAIGWFLGDAIGLVGIAPFLLVHVFPHVRTWLAPPLSQVQPTTANSAGRVISLGSIAEACAQSVVIFAVLWMMFGIKEGRYSHLYLSFIPIIWIAMRQGIRRVVIGLLVLNFGIAMAMHLFPPTAAQFAEVALLMLVTSTVGLIVGSEVSERHRMAIELNDQTLYLDSLIQNSPLGIVVLDRKGCVQLTNSAFERLFQYSRQELAAIDVGSMGVPDDQVKDSEQLIPLILAGHAVQKTVRRLRKDRQALDLALHGVPLVLNGKVRGAYLIYEDVSDQIVASEAQRQHAESLDRLVKELELRTKQMIVLNEMGSLLECCATVKEASLVVANSMQQLFPDAPSGALYVVESSRHLIEEVVRWGKIGVSEASFLPDACWSLRRGQPHWSGQSGSGVSCQHLSQSSTAECVCIPMVAQGNTVGVLHLEFESATKFQPTHGTDKVQQLRERLAISAASQIALSLASLQLQEILREQSIRDPLTRLFNRRFLEESLERELQLAGRKQQPLAILLVDLDHFKKFNDTFGHDAGDLVLRSLADLFRTFFRASDICCRYGGEEFMIILPESSSQDAAIRADALRAQVKSMRLHYKKEALGPLTLSAGIAAFPEHGLTSEGLLKTADQCLYESKARGRDIVTVAGPQSAALLPTLSGRVPGGATQRAGPADPSCPETLVIVSE